MNNLETAQKDGRPPLAERTVPEDRPRGVEPAEDGPEPAEDSPEPTEDDKEPSGSQGSYKNREKPRVVERSR